VVRGYNHYGMRSQAINTNYHLIQKKLLIRDLTQYNHHTFLLSAARWSFRTHGYGKADLDGYLQYLENKPSKKRLWNTNVILWYSLRKTIFERDNYTCKYCGIRGGKLEVDHIIPISSGGTDDPNNLITSCRRCNRQKGGKSIDEFENWKKSETLEETGSKYATTTYRLITTADSDNGGIDTKEISETASQIFNDMTGNLE